MKITIEQQQTNNEALAKLFNKCYEDASFKERLINSPQDAVKEIDLGLEVDEGKTLVFEDQTDANFIYLNIPAVPNLEELELTEEQMEVVAGGCSTMSLGFEGGSSGWKIKAGYSFKF